MVIKCGSGMMEIRCGCCGERSDFDLFTRTELAGDLPPGQFQCPRCNYAWQLRSAGPVRILTAASGERMAFREKVELVAVQARL